MILNTYVLLAFGMALALYSYVNAKKHKTPAIGIEDAPFIPVVQPLDPPSLHLPLPDSPYPGHENAVAEIKITEETTERGVWTIDM